MGTPFLHTRHHIIKECPRHSQHRHIIEKADEYVTEPEWTIDRLGEPKVMLPGFIEYLKASVTFTKKDIPFKLNLILLPPKPPHDKPP
jgi:hypothetical protein